MSTLRQLKDIPFDIIKVDKSFLERVSATRDSDVVAILKTIVILARELHRSVIVEGVESEADAAWLRELGCDYAQGYYFGQPIPRADVVKYITERLQAEDESEAAKEINRMMPQARPA
jgi:EAL domain-containing protein (putative c-di-GMP-specific phosphodiesterase class I)